MDLLRSTFRSTYSLPMAFESLLGLPRIGLGADIPTNLFS